MTTFHSPIDTQDTTTTTTTTTTITHWSQTTTTSLDLTDTRSLGADDQTMQTLFY